MFVSMSYAWELKVSVGGLGNVGIRTYINMDLFNKDAKKVFELDEYATSKKSVALVSGAPVMNYDKLMPMCENATEELLNPKLLNDIPCKAYLLIDTFFCQGKI